MTSLGFEGDTKQDRNEVQYFERYIQRVGF